MKRVCFSIVLLHILLLSGIAKNKVDDGIDTLKSSINATDLQVIASIYKSKLRIEIKNITNDSIYLKMTTPAVDGSYFSLYHSLEGKDKFVGIRDFFTDDFKLLFLINPGETHTFLYDMSKIGEISFIDYLFIYFIYYHSAYQIRTIRQRVPIKKIDNVYSYVSCW